jgi:hypothetical protein
MVTIVKRNRLDSQFLLRVLFTRERKDWLGIYLWSNMGVGGGTRIFYFSLWEIHAPRHHNRNKNIIYFKWNILLQMLGFYTQEQGFYFILFLIYFLFYILKTIICLWIFFWGSWFGF